MKGGYKIIDFKNVSLSGTPVTMTDVLVDLLNNYEKVVLLSHVVLSGSAKDDCFSTVLSDGEGGLKLNCYDGFISISSAGAVTYTVASPSGMAEDLSALKNTTRRTQRNITTDLINLPMAVAEQNLEKYGYAIGDYFVGTHYTYVLGDLDTYYGGYNNQAVVNVHHVGVLVITGATSAWGSTSGGYNGSTLQSYLEGTVLTNIKADMIALFGGTTGLEHLLSHSKLFTTNDTTGWAWQSGKYISALSEIQMGYGHVFSMNAYQSGEAVKPLEVFRKFRFNEIFGNIWIWLRNLMSVSDACGAGDGGGARDAGVSDARYVVGLILFK